MNVLVAYASKRGSTEEIAHAVAETLHDGGLDVDCLRASDVGDLDRYDAVVLGSAVYMRAGAATQGASSAGTPRRSRAGPSGSSVQARSAGPMRTIPAGSSRGRSSLRPMGSG
jgi:menaquinone-dependent protoporphyrinogen oxidase